MVEDKEYNGWSNFETWKLALNLDNEESLYKQFRNYKGDAADLKAELEGMFNHEDIGYKICDFWSNNEWQEIDWQEILESRQEKD